MHAGRCEWRNEFEVERILNCKGPTCNRMYLLQWKNYSQEHNSWVPRTNLHPEAIKDFEVENGKYVKDWPFRCGICDLPCKSERGVKLHSVKTHKNDKTIDKAQTFQNSAADKAVRNNKLAEQQKSRSTVFCEGEPVENLLRFIYLGSSFYANGKQVHDIKARIALAMKRCDAVN